MNVEEDQKDVQPSQPDQPRYIQMKRFTFFMLIFVLIFATAGGTLLALSFGEEKPVARVIQDQRGFDKLYKAYDELEKNYYTKVDKDKLLNGAIDGMVKALDDPYSDYMTKEESEKFQESISSSFQGIGAEVQEQNGSIIVVSPIKGSPAEKAGILPNDKIAEVDGKSVQGMSANEAVMLIRGEKGTKVTLTIERAGQSEPLKVTITRDEIPINTVYADMLDNGVAKIQITSFSTHTDQDLAEAMKEMEGKGMKSLILDLRQNPGGLLEQAVKISNLFVDKDKLLFQVEERSGGKTEYRANESEKFKLPMVVLIDGGSASASEIVAGALSESAGIKLVGVKSFGKGTVQTQEIFKDKSNIKYTMAKWLTPDGNWIHGKGIKPDYEVQMPKYAELTYINPEEEYKVGSISKDVNTAEEVLQVLGYNPGTIDNNFDEQTKTAIESFQKDENLEATGTLKGETTIALMNKIREHLVANDPQVKKAEEVLNGIK